MKPFWHKKGVILFFFILIEASLIFILFQDLQVREKSYQRSRLSETHIAYEAILTNYEKVAQVVFDQAINQPPVLNIVDQAYQASPESQQQLRDQLYLMLSPLYQNLLEDNFKQLHFHFPDHTSFLRFHRPEKFGDDLSDVRYSVVMANENLTPVFGFEEGRIYNGFRYVFPLFMEERHIGSVEISVSFSALEEELRKLFPQDFAFLLKQDVIQDKVFEDEQSNYQISDIDPNYAYEIAVINNERQNENRILSEETIKHINQALPQGFHDLLNRGEAGTQVVFVDGNTYLVSFLPIKNILGEQAAYLITYREEIVIPGYRHDFWLMAAGITIILIFVMALVLVRQQSMETAEKNQKRLLAISDHMQELLLVFDQDYLIRFINQAACSSLGVNRADVVGMHIEDFLKRVFEIDSEQIEEFRKNLRMNQKVEGSLETRLHKDQALHIFEHALRPLVLEHSSGYLLVFRDVTERWQTERFLKQAKEEAEAGARAKSQFLAAMSHEIRTPMNAVIGMTSLLAETKLTAEQRDFVETIRLGGESLLTVINDILDFSKLDTDHLELDIHTFNLQRCVDDAVELTFNQASQKGLELISLIDPKVPRMVEGDATRIRQILVNLISNAIKFTDRGEVFVSVKLVKEGLVLFEVRDTGIGIPYDRVERLFKPFSQVDASTTRRFGGTGLGLVICKRLVDMMGGRIWVESMPGEGSLFSFEIPLKTGQPEPLILQENVEDSLIGKHVLVVDDHENNRRVLALMLRNWGMTSEVFSDSWEALKRLQREHYFDLCILDYQMPGLDGVMLADAIKEIKAADAIPIILLSSAGSQELTSLRQKNIFTQVVNKPLRQSRLYNILVEVLANQPQRPSKHLPQPPIRLDQHLAEKVPLRILVAEDNAVNQRLALLILQKMGYRADAVADGMEVLQALERQAYDIIFMDVQMPILDGLETTKRIHQNWQQLERRPRIIAMTANAMPDDHKQCLLAGMDDYLSKPIRLEQVQTMLEKWGGARTPHTSVQQNGTQTLDWNVILDQEIIKDLHAMGTEAFASLRDLFISEGEETLAMLSQDLMNQDPEEIRRMAHSLKGSALNMGAAELSEAARQLEFAAKEGRSDGFQQIFEYINEEFERTKLALNKI